MADGYIRLCDLTRKERRKLNRLVRRQRRMKAPCKDCDRRKFLCHSQCEKYKEFKKQLAEVAEARMKLNAATPEPCRKVARQMWREMKK